MLFSRSCSATAARLPLGGWLSCALRRRGPGILRASDGRSREPEDEPRLRTVRMLKDAAFPEAAVPLARLVTDPEDAVQLEAIAAELNIFLAAW